MAELWVVGSLNTDLIWNTPRFVEPGETLTGSGYCEVPGGKGGNQAMALARLGCHPRVVGCVGDDDRGQRYRRRLAEAGADVSRLHTVDAPTGLAMIEVAASGENRITVIPGANAELSATQVETDLADLQAGDVVLFQLEIPFETVHRAITVAQGKGAVVILDPAPAKPLPTEVYSLVTVLTPNETESRILLGWEPQSKAPLDLAPARELLGLGVANVVQKAGKHGAILVQPRGETAVAPFVMRVVDTVGAGDAFNAGLAMALSEGRSLAEAVRWGNATGALSTQAPGAQAGLPTREAVQALLDSAS